MKINENKLKELNELSGGNTNLMKDLLEKFYINSIKLLDSADEAFKNEDFKKIEYVVHTLKGSALSLGLEPLGEFITNFNQKLKKTDHSNLQSTLEKLREDVILSRELISTL